MTRQSAITQEATALMLYIEAMNFEVEKVGGARFDIRHLNKITALEFLSMIAPNGLVICIKGEGKYTEENTK